MSKYSYVITVYAIPDRLSIKNTALGRCFLLCVILPPVFHVTGLHHRQLRVGGFPGNGFLFFVLHLSHPAASMRRQMGVIHRNEKPQLICKKRFKGFFYLFDTAGCKRTFQSRGIQKGQEVNLLRVQIVGKALQTRTGTFLLQLI